MINDKQHITRKKTRQRANSQKITPDLFCRLVFADTGCECVREYRFHATRRWRFDYAIPAHKIAIEVEGGVYTNGRHTRPTGFLGDMEKYNTATLYGWRLFRTTPKDLITTKTLRMIVQAIAYEENANKK